MADDLASLTTGGAWLSMFSSFLEDLSGQFPADAEIEAATARANDADATIVDEFVDVVSSRQTLLTAKDPEFFADLKIAGIDFGRLWSAEEMHDQSRIAIWSYFSSLSMIATTLRSIPPETLSMIENAARSIAGQFASSGGGPGGMPDLSSLMSMMGGLGGLDLGMLGAPPAPRATRERLAAPPASSSRANNKKKKHAHKPNV